MPDQAQDPQKAAKQAERDARAARKAAKEAEEALRIAKLEAAQRDLDMELLSVERSGDEELSSDDAVSALAKRDAQAARAREAYIEETRNLRERHRAAWAARKVLDARSELKEIKRVTRSTVRAAERKLEHREAFFLEPLCTWSWEQPRTSKTGFQLREARLRIECRTREPGIQVEDERAAAYDLVRQLGPTMALLEGVVRVEYVLERDAARRYAEEHKLSVDGMFRRETPERTIKIVPL